MDRRVSHVIATMGSNLRRKLTLTEMAKSVGLTPEHLCRVFKTEVGLSPGRYLKQIRMREAERLLVGTFLSVKEITTTAGFTDESHFVRDFKSVYGLTPTQYRSRERGDIPDNATPRNSNVGHSQ